ncbi:hypothetical protein ACJX0J_039713, partial [Zea mays]
MVNFNLNNSCDTNLDATQMYIEWQEEAELFGLLRPQSDDPKLVRDKKIFFTISTTVVCMNLLYTARFAFKWMSGGGAVILQSSTPIMSTNPNPTPAPITSHNRLILGTQKQFQYNQIIYNKNS